MAGEQEDPGEAASRLEQALERIAKAAEARNRKPATDAQAPAELGARVDREILARLDALIGELRAVLGGKPD